jgi:LPXTG-motif cell wall-anchored protein
VSAYFDSEYHTQERDGSPAAVYTGAFMNLTEDTADSSSTVQEYSGAGGDGTAPMTVAFPITSVSKLASTSLLPASCTPNDDEYDAAYEITYAPSTTKFSEVIAGETYTSTVTLTSPTLYLGLNFDSGQFLGLDENAPICATSTLGTLYAENDGDQPDSAPDRATIAATPFVASATPTGPDAWISAALIASNQVPVNLTTLAPSVSDWQDPTGTTVSGASFAVVAQPVLAATGVNAAPAGILGGSLLLAGGGAFVYGRRRRRVPRV